MLAVCLFIMGTTHAMTSSDDKKEEVKSVPIPISTGWPSSGNDARGVVDIPFTAYYQAGTIYISTSAEFTSISITITNESTGQVWNSATDISDGMGEICIFDGGAGSYIVEIVTEYGECFTGSFRL